MQYSILSASFSIIQRHIVFSTSIYQRVFTRHYVGKKTLREKRGKFYNSEPIKKGTSSTRQNS
jgi:hypothetical protein